MVRAARLANLPDGENDGPYQDEEVVAPDEADVVWKFNLIEKLGVHPHERSTCSLTCADEVLLVITGNGVDNGHIRIPAPQAPSFMALNRRTAEVLWTDASPGENILHGQWSSPAYAVLGGKPQMLVGGGDGRLDSFDPRGDGRGRARLWWKFDANPKTAEFVFGGRGTKNEIFAPPVIYELFVPTEEGQMWVFAHGKTRQVLAENNIGHSSYTTPVVAGNVLYFSTRSTLFAVAAPAD